MKYEMIPSVKLADIVQEINDRHDIKVTEYDLRSILWGERPPNDCYKEYYYGDGSDEYCHPLEALVIDLLEDYFPDWDTVLINVSW